MQPNTDVTLAEQPPEARIRQGLAHILAFEGRHCTPEDDIISICEQGCSTRITFSQNAWQNGWPCEMESTDIMRTLSEQAGGSWSYAVAHYAAPTQTVVFNGTMDDLAQKLDARARSV